MPGGLDVERQRRQACVVGCGEHVHMGVVPTGRQTDREPKVTGSTLS